MVLAGGGGVLAACLGDGAGGDAPLVRSVTERGELLLADGRMVLAAGIAFPDEAIAIAAMRAILDSDGIRLAGISKNADRWGRYRAHLAAAGGGGPFSVAERLVGQGAALLHPGEVETPARRGAASRGTWGLAVSPACADRLMALEKEARRARAGVWRGPAALPLDAKNPTLLQRYAGRFVIVEGEIVSVGERRAMTFLNFGKSWRRDFSVMISRKDWEKLEKEGFTTAMLTGKRIAVRGEILLREGVEPPAGRAPVMRVSAGRSLDHADTD